MKKREMRVWWLQGINLRRAACHRHREKLLP
jgi:hypothetical protein